jgi:hypothetical protein
LLLLWQKASSSHELHRNCGNQIPFKAAVYPHYFILSSHIDDYSLRIYWQIFFLITAENFTPVSKELKKIDTLSEVIDKSH